MNRAPALKLIIDIAGIGVKPPMRSGPYFLIVYKQAAEIISNAS